MDGNGIGTDLKQTYRARYANEQVNCKGGPRGPGTQIVTAIIKVDHDALARLKAG